MTDSSHKPEEAGINQLQQPQDDRSWHAGAGIPDNTLGRDEDWYFQTDTTDFYKKHCGEWTFQQSLRNYNMLPPADPGPTEPPGESGEPGISKRYFPTGRKGPAPIAESYDPALSNRERAWAKDVHLTPDIPHWILQEWPDGTGPVAVGNRFHPVGEYLLLQHLPSAQRLAGPGLKPSYSIVTEFRRGQGIGAHFDQNPWSEIVVGLLLHLEGQDAWPLYYGAEGRFKMVEGDGYILSGHEIAHWREPLEGTRAVVATLRYTATDKFPPRPFSVEEGARRGRALLKRYASTW